VINTNYQITAEKKIKVNRLDAILADYLPKGINFDFMSIDVEGYDWNVLKSNNWELYRPKCLLVESLESSLSSVFDCPMYRYLIDRDYELFAKTFNSLFYMDRLKQD
jgi:hypothetical protein